MLGIWFQWKRSTLVDLFCWRYLLSDNIFRLCKSLWQDRKSKAQRVNVNKCATCMFVYSSKFSNYICLMKTISPILKKIVMSPKWKIKFDISNIVLNSQRDNSRWCIVYKHHWPHSILLPNLFWVSECDSLENGNYL